MDYVKEIQKRFGDLLNYDSDDITSAIDPVSWRSPEGDSCLHYAAMRGDSDSIRVLVKLGVDVNLVGDMGKTALHYARTSDQDGAAQTLTELGADSSILDEFGKQPGG